MSSISLYIAPFGLKSPCEVPIYPRGQFHDVAEQIDELVKQHQLEATRNQLAIPPEISPDLIPTPGRLWVLFCLTRRTIIPAQIVNDLCKVLANDASGVITQFTNNLLADGTTGATVGKFIVLPIPKIYTSSGTLFGTLSPSVLPSQPSLAYTTHSEYLNSIPRCWSCAFMGKGSRCSSCMECANRVFHLKRVTCPPWNMTKAKNYIHLGLWIPRIAAPCDLIWDVTHDPIPKISGIIRSLQPKTRSDASSKNDSRLWGDYPSEENWTLLEFATERFLPQQHFRDLRGQSKLAGQSQTYAVIPVHCGSLANAMLEAVRKEGSIGWENFWQKRLCICTRSVSAEDAYGEDDISTSGLRTPSTPDYSPYDRFGIVDTAVEKELSPGGLNFE